jgi:hypothetical protein
MSERGASPGPVKMPVASRRKALSWFVGSSGGLRLAMCRLPNTRVQRTRSSASPPRSPLTRYPLGAPGITVRGRRRLVGAIVLGALIAARGDGGASDQLDAASLTAEQILGRVGEVYSKCKSYRDSGSVTTVFYSAVGKHSVEKPFRTAFVRPDRFRFEYYDKSEPVDRFVIWRQGESVRTWWGIEPGVHDARSLGNALAAATGVSSGSARRIPGLLLAEPIEAGWEIRRLKTLRRLPDAKLREAECLVVQGETSTRRGEPVVLWIAKSTFLIRRIDEATKFDDFRTEETTTYEPRIDTEIPVNLLDFAVPLQQ